LNRLLHFIFVVLCFTAPSFGGTTFVPDAPLIKLDEIGLYRIGYAYRGLDAVMFPSGWTGIYEDHTGIGCRNSDKYESRNAFLLHVPWRGGVGITFQEFTVKFPKVKHISLRGGVAMMPFTAGKSDGVTFRVMVNGNKLLDIHRTEIKWKDFSLDLTKYAGSTTIIRFEVDPGPKDDPSWDYSVWGDRELVLDGYHPKTVSHPIPPALDITRLFPVQNNSMTPASGFTGKVKMHVEGETARFTYEGTDGTLEYRWTKPANSSVSPFGNIQLLAKMRGDHLVQLGLGNAALIEWTGEAKFISSKWQKSPQCISCISEYIIGQQTIHLASTAKISGKSLVMDVSCDKPVIQKLNPGDWGPVLRKKLIPVPYYSGLVNYLPFENLFVSTYFDWYHSSASSNDGPNAYYNALTDGTRNLLKERIIHTAAWHMDEVLPNIPNPVSPYRKEVGGKMILDVWSMTFADIADKMKILSDYGITNCIGLIHQWQRSGYDNALPMHYPADPKMGGDSELKHLVQVGKQLGFRMALHENYVDYYPDYDFFNENDISLDSSGNRVTSWYNTCTNMQAFAVKPSAILRLASTQSPEINKLYSTDACYLDCHSGVPLWFHVDFRAGEPGAGTFKPVVDAHKDLWNFARKTYGGPVFGEGNGHWVWSGLLDGVEAQFGTGWPANQGMDVPLMVDFDLTRIHPLQANHGMGYYERWWSTDVKWKPRPPMIVLDQYRMQQIAYGHTAYASPNTWFVLPLAWLEYNLVTLVAARYATARPKTIGYLVSDKWLDGTSASKQGQWQVSRVRYDNGLVITANNSKSSIKNDGIELPQFGWMAKGAGVFAYTGKRNGVIVDYAQTKDVMFANARNSVDWMDPAIKNIHPSVDQFNQTGPGEFKVNYSWKVGETLSKDYRCFVHISKTAEETSIDFQQDHDLDMPTSKWKAGSKVEDGPYDVHLPDTLKDGDYIWYIGLWTPKTGKLTLDGAGDGRDRIKLGMLQVRDS